MFEEYIKTMIPPMYKNTVKTLRDFSSLRPNLTIKILYDINEVFHTV